MSRAAEDTTTRTGGASGVADSSAAAAAAAAATLFAAFSSLYEPVTHQTNRLVVSTQQAKKRGFGVFVCCRAGPIFVFQEQRRTTQPALLIDSLQYWYRI